MDNIFVSQEHFSEPTLTSHLHFPSEEIPYLILSDVPLSENLSGFLWVRLFKGRESEGNSDVHFSGTCFTECIVMFHRFHWKMYNWTSSDKWNKHY